MASRPLKDESWFHHVDSSRLGRLERARAVVTRCNVSYEVSLGAAPGTISVIMRSDKVRRIMG
ncbi:hypothetical protein BS47DRAFT_1339463 [Hydnum rufescens UP504]|uniref:Uncharacterized protein n=1 Tax=Hydnum rufescens UP504 TaxID=1448309 RepID=A0A9P6B4J4_9AGAM|nr:hypothetical protein BS47DRAFT_1339463 [Hydnum rufescens UP504]